MKCGDEDNDVLLSLQRKTDCPLKCKELVSIFQNSLEFKTYNWNDTISENDTIVQSLGKLLSD